MYEDLAPRDSHASPTLPMRRLRVLSPPSPTRPTLFVMSPEPSFTLFPTTLHESSHFLPSLLQTALCPHLHWSPSLLCLQRMLAQRAAHRPG